MEIIIAVTIIAFVASSAFLLTMVQGDARLERERAEAPRPERSYVLHVLHNVESRRSLDIENGYL